MSDFLKQKCSEDRWEKAQKMELQEWVNFSGSDDWNSWWKKKFDDYQFMKDKSPQSVAEVGCGPFARNITYIIESMRGDPSEVTIQDPLIRDYIKLHKRVEELQRSGYKIAGGPLETLKLENPVDCLICINVLDHVFDAQKCFDAMYENLNDGGILIFGQDLSDEADGKKLPDADTMHPIRFDEAWANKHLSRYAPIFRKVLPRKEGRNPPHHYATMLFAGIK